MTAYISFPVRLARELLPQQSKMVLYCYPKKYLYYMTIRMITYHFISFIRQHYPIHFVGTTLYLPFQCTDLPMDSGDQNVLHSCCRLSNGSTLVDDTAYMYVNI